MTIIESSGGLHPPAAPVFVGRTRELQRLEKVLAEARVDGPRVVLLAGEAGSGKSTLVEELFRRAERSDPPYACVAGECSATTGLADAFLPFRAILKRLTGDDGNPQKRNGDLLATAGKVLAETAPELLSIFLPGSKLIAEMGFKFAREAGWVGKAKEEPPPVPAELDQEKIFRQYTEVLQAVARQRPLIVALDDLQWADASSIALFFHLARMVRQARLVLIGTFRPNDVALGRGGERHPLEQVIFELKRYFGDIVVDLSAGGGEERRAFVDQLLDREPNRLDEQFRTALMRHTDGHPLFTVELLRDLRERGCLTQNDGQWVVARDVNWGALPARIEGVIAERVGRLEKEQREILTIASVGVGTSHFLAQTVAKIQNIDERQLLKLLSADLDKRHGLILEAGVVRRGRRILAHYRFTHALVQRFLYSDLSDAEKMLLHGDVAAFLEELYENDCEQIATDLAYHYEQAGDAENALRFCEIVLDQCLRVSAYQEALVHANRALELIEELPDTPERAKREFALILRWSAPTKALRGWTSPDLAARYDRARELTRRIGDCREVTEFLFAVWTYCLVRCELAEALDIARQCREMAERVGESMGLLAAETSLTNTTFWCGDLAACREHLRKVPELYKTVDATEQLLQYGMDTRVVVNEFEVWIDCLEGNLDEAMATWLEFLPQAESLKHPFSLAIALNTGAWMYQMRGDAAATRATAERLLELASHHGFPSYVGLGTMLRGWALGFEDVEAGLAGIDEGFAAWQSTAGDLLTTYRAVLFADTLLRADRREAALATIDRALRFAAERGENVFVGLLERMRVRAGAALV